MSTQPNDYLKSQNSQYIYSQMYVRKTPRTYTYTPYTIQKIKYCCFFVSWSWGRRRRPQQAGCGHQAGRGPGLRALQLLSL